MASSGPNSPGTLADDSSFGTNAWSNPSNASASDNIYATAACNSLLTTRYLNAQNFSFAIPEGATINGIVVEVEKKTSTGTDTTDSRMRIIKGGSVGSTDKASGSAWSTSEAYTSYGSSSDLWGTTWAATDINASNFGALIAVRCSNIMPRTASIDHIRITVYYTAASENDSATTHYLRLVLLAQ